LTLRGKLLMGALALTFLGAGGADAAPSVYPTGVTIYDPARAYNSYVLFGDASAGARGETHLIDMNCNEVHSWDWGGFPSRMVDPALAGGKRGVIGVQTSH